MVENMISMKSNYLLVQLDDGYNYLNMILSLLKHVIISPQLNNKKITKTLENQAFWQFILVELRGIDCNIGNVGST